MTFAEFEIADAEGAILAHSVKLGNQVIKKGHRLTKADLSLFATQGVKRVFAARLDPDDVGEDEAAGLVAAAIAGPGTVVHEASTGRANIHARNAGVAVIDADRLNSLNRLHESLTIATLPPFGTAAERQMVATVKIIPFAVPRAIVTKAACNRWPGISDHGEILCAATSRAGDHAAAANQAVADRQESGWSPLAP